MLRRGMMAGGAGGPPPGVDPYFPQVAALLHFEEADNSTSPVDQKGHTWIGVAGAKVSRTAPLEGVGSCLITGTGGPHFYTLDSADFDLAANDFTGEVRVKFTNLPASGNAASLFVKWGSSGPLLDYWLYLYNSGGTYYLYFNFTVNGYTGGAPFVTWTPTAGVDYLVAVEREGDEYRFYVNDVQQGSPQTAAGSIHRSSVNMTLGSTASSAYTLDGKIDEFRLTVGVARRRQVGYTLIQPFPDS